MTLIQTPGVRLKWRCKRCGKDDGVAKSTVPLPGFLTDAVVRQGLLNNLTPRVLQYHATHDSCAATWEDIEYQPIREKEPIRLTKES